MISSILIVSALITTPVEQSTSSNHQSFSEKHGAWTLVGKWDDFDSAMKCQMDIESNAHGQAGRYASGQQFFFFGPFDYVSYPRFKIDGGEIRDQTYATVAESINSSGIFVVDVNEIANGKLLTVKPSDNQDAVDFDISGVEDAYSAAIAHQCQDYYPLVDKKPE